MVTLGWGKNGNRCVDAPTRFIPWSDWLASKGARFLLFARSQSRCEADAQDLLQEALVEAWQRGDGQHPPDDSLVFTTLRRRAIDLGRRADRRVRREQAAPGWFEPDTPLHAPELDAEVARAVEALSQPLREVLVMKIWTELTFQQIADTLGISINTVSARYRYALGHLRNALKEVHA